MGQEDLHFGFLVVYPMSSPLDINLRILTFVFIVNQGKSAVKIVVFYL